MSGSGRGLLIAVVLVAAFAQRIGIAGPASDTTVVFGVWPHTSLNSIPPMQNNPNSPIVYVYTIHSGDPITDTIPLSVCLDSKAPGTLDTSTGWTDQVAFDHAAGDFASDIAAVNSPWSFTQASTVSTGAHSDADPGCQAGALTINVPSGALTTVGTNVYTTNIFFQNQDNCCGTGPGAHLKDSIETNHLQIQVNVLAADASRISCFMTDSEGDLLRQCDGAEVTASGSSDGTFSIIANKKGTAVSTNPGQFYYNVLWRNDTGADQTVSVSMAANGFIPNGTQAVHWLNFPTAGFAGVTPGDFGDVIEGNPAGKTGTVTGILVPAGDTLYVTYHLEWNGLRATAPACGECGAAQNVLAAVSASVTGTFGTDQCTAGAKGHDK